MPHIFPQRAFRVGEVVDPDTLNEVFQEVAGKFVGRLNEHDVSSDLKTKIGVADEAYYDAHQIKRASDPWFTFAVPSYAVVDGNPAGQAAADVEDSEGWQRLIDVGGTQDMSLTLTTGEDTLVLFAQMQHVGWRSTGITPAAPEINSPLRLQYALRVDGALLDDTITGAAVYPDTPPQQWYRAEPATIAPVAAAYDFDYRHIQYLTGTIGISCAMHPVRVVRAFPATAGSHSIEVVARRLPAADYKTDNSQEGATVQVFNRRLVVLRIKGGSPGSSDIPSVNIQAFNDGQVVAAADITTNAFSVLSATANNLGNANLERGVFRNQHLPSVVYGPVATPISPAVPTAIFSGVYPGYGVNSAAWTVINDGLGLNLRIIGPTAGQWDLVANPGLFVVLANVDVFDIRHNPTTAPIDIQAIVVLALRITNSVGTVTLLGETEVYINGHNPDPEDPTPTMRAVQTDAPLMWAIDSTQLSAPNRRITRVEVVGSVWDASYGGRTVEVRTQRGMIYGFVLKGVYL